MLSAFRFEFYLLSQLLVLFGSLIFPWKAYETHLLPVLFIVNILAGMNLTFRRKLLFWPLLVLLIGFFYTFGSALFIRESVGNESLRLTFYFVFHLIVCYELIRQVWRSEEIDRHVIFGLMSGYISLGFLGFLVFSTIELNEPGSFVSTLMGAHGESLHMDVLMYHAFITLMTIGFGEILPATPLAQKAAVLVGLSGQFYLVILTAVVVGKYLRTK